MLPAIKAMKSLGHKVLLYVQTDFPTSDLWRRCVYADEVHEIEDLIVDAPIVCGQWIPAAWRNRAELRSITTRYQIMPPYSMPEWRSNLRLAEHLGWRGGNTDVSGWCRRLDRSPRWDVGIVPGCKGGVWLRKRWPGLAEVAAHFLRQGKKVAVFGLESDGVTEIPGEKVDTTDLRTLPDALAGCRVMVGIDSGVMHLASSLGIPAVMIFTATSHVKGRPVGPARLIVPDADLFCFPCVSTPQWHACADWRCRDHNPETAIRAAEEMLEGSR
jgi:hypothetical protein